jgi:hypothetical protein
MKKIDTSAHRGDSGIALIHQHVNDMGFVWHERKTDAGIDGMIELRDAATDVVTNQHLLAQSKASERKFPGETDSSFHYLCKPDDIDYWMKASQPVLLICSHPSAGQAWWAHIQSWFSDPERRAARRIDVDKATQCFDKSAVERLGDLNS